MTFPAPLADLALTNVTNWFLESNKPQVALPERFEKQLRADAAGGAGILLVSARDEIVGYTAILRPGTDSWEASGFMNQQRVEELGVNRALVCHAAARGATNLVMLRPDNHEGHARIAEEWPSADALTLPDGTVAYAPDGRFDYLSDEMRTTLKLEVAS